MASGYQHLTMAERVTLMVGLAEGASLRSLAGDLGRSPSTLSREVARNPAARGGYDALLGHQRAQARLAAPGINPKLGPRTGLLAAVKDQLREGLSPEQIAAQLARAFPGDRTRTVCHETIYTAIYVMPRGALRREVIGHLRQARGKRRPRSRGEDRRGRIPGMVSIALRPPEIEDRLVPGHWEGDLIKGAFNRSSVATLVERTSRLVVLARMEDATAEGALSAFSDVLGRVHKPMRKTMTYDQGKEMARHKELTAATGVAVFFADPHSPWQRGSNENTNGLLRQYLPKGADLSTFSQADLDAIAQRLNRRPRKVHGFRTPNEVYVEHLRRAQDLLTQDLPAQDWGRERR